MASFTALNIEPDDQSDDEVDNTKELQIEEALKLYQIALKLHSQGPELYPQAAEAYSNLFKSEIFKYPESVTEFARLDEHPEVEFAETSFAPLDLAAAGADGAPSTLPQILYLSHKNHGQFILDCVKSHIRHTGLQQQVEPLSKPELDYQAKAALINFALALASDESDTELWRRAARIGSMLGSRRIARYCLEAAVEVDDDPTVAEVDPPSLEEGFAGEQLKEHLQVLSDEVSLSHPIMKPFLRKKMAPSISKYMDPYTFLPDPTKSLGTDTPENDRAEVTQARIIMDIATWSWTALGDAICIAMISLDGLAGKGVALRFPAPVDNVGPTNAPLAISTEDQIMKDVGVTESPVGESSETAAPTPVTAKSDDQPVKIVTTTSTVPISDGRQRSQSISLPTRKRSQSAAGIRDTPEDDSGTQKRSKRIRNRDSTMEIDPATQFAEQLKAFVRADEDVFGFVSSLLTKIGVDDLGIYPELQAVLAQEGPSGRLDTLSNTAVRDLRDVLRTWDDDKASTFVNANAADILGSSAGANAGLAAFLENTKSGPLKQSTKPIFGVADGLAAFTQKVDNDWMPLQDLIWEWLCEVLVTYQSTLWPEDFKIAVVRIISFGDPDIYTRLQLDIERVRSEGGKEEERTPLEEMAQILFELHLDIYSRITNPNSIVNYETRIMTKDRLDRWADFAADIIRSRLCQDNDELSLRYLWASVFYATMVDNISREHKVLCWSDLQAILEDSGKPMIELPNNAVMPEISVFAAEREVSRLTTMDFFFNLFQTDTSNPLAIIETLEPVLDPESTLQPEDAENEDTIVVSETADGTPAALRDMWKFLKGGSTSLRLFLWQRLREAYFSLGYNTKVFSCYLKSIEIIVADLRTDDYVDSAEGPRQHRLLSWLKALDDLLVRSLTIALNDAATCFEIIDERHLKTTCAAIAQLNRVLHSAALFDDEVRLGMIQLPQTAVYGAQGSFTGFINKLREMQVRTWALQYTMVKESMSQNRELFLQPDKDLADFLALVHYSLGLRKCCKASNKIFLKMMKVEMIRLKQVDRWEDYLGQVLYDLYGIRLGVGTYLLEEHGCPTETLDKRTVLNIAEQVIILANRMSMKDLLKHELRTTIERMQTAIGAAKSTPQMMHNLRNLTEYLKTSIRPLHLYQALKGRVEIDSIPVLTADSILAENGWYFLQGMIALTKFRSQKRLGPGGQTDDMRVAATFMRLQLQYTADHWEAWYRLAQCFDFELEDEVMWSAEKINNDRPVLVRLQLSAIHCYVMALSTTMRCADDQFETLTKINEMYHDFGMRLYASSREPFAMEAFYVDDFEKHMSGSGDVGMYKQALHKEMTRYMVWQYACELFRRSAVNQPNNWMNYFMIGKCRWKMYSKFGDDSGRDPASKPSVESILDAFVNAIKTVPKPRDSRQEPILEPHYKLVSIVYKLVIHGAVEPQAGANLLQEQPYAIRKGEHIDINDQEDWEPFVLESFRHLRAADKQHWHHRMIARVASILYDESRPDYVQASAARHEFRESIFTKTMHIQVWKPDAERPGRHCVYMERYVRLMIKLLWIVNDKASMEALAKRVRKKANDFHRFTQVWNDCCTTYLRLIRRAAQIPPNMDEVFKTVPHEDFEIFSDRLADWVADPNLSHPALEALREAIELKKLNQGKMKCTPIDDMINDAWAVLYTQVALKLPGPNPSDLHRSQIDGGAESAPASRPLGPMSLNNLVMNMDGTQIPVPVAFAGSSESAGARPRKVGIGRREVLRRAELAINRVPEAPRPLAPSKPRNPVSETPTALVLGSNAPPLQEREPEQDQRVSEAQPDVSSTVQNGDGEEGEDKEARAEREASTAPGSLHDSADDESDLSDVPDMDEAEQALMFPGLMDRTTGSSGGEGTSTPKE